jgi:hypothetical protein
MSAQFSKLRVLSSFPGRRSLLQTSSEGDATGCKCTSHVRDSGTGECIRYTADSASLIDFVSADIIQIQKSEIEGTNTTFSSVGKNAEDTPRLRQ